MAGTGFRKLIFLSALLALVAALCGACRKSGEQAAASAPLPVADEARVAALVARLNVEDIAPGQLGGMPALFPGEFDRHVCPAADELVALGPAAVRPLRKALAGPDAAVSRNAAFALARLGETASADRLWTATEDTRLPPFLRAQALGHLATLAEKQPDRVPIDFSRLEPIFESRSQVLGSSRHLRVAILRAAPLAGGAEARELVLAQLDSRDPALRHAAIEAVRGFNLPEPPAAVTQALDDRNPRVVVAAMRTLTAWKTPALGRQLARLLKHSEPGVRIQAVQLIAASPPDNAAALLAEALGDADLAVQREAVTTMEQLGDVRALETALSNHRWRIRKQVVEALGRMKSARSLPALATLARDDSFNVRAALAAALGEIAHPAGAPVAVELLSDPASSVRDAAQAAFFTLSGDRLEDFNPGDPPWKNQEAIGRARKWADEHAADAPLPKEDGGAASSDHQPGPADADVAKLIAELASPQPRVRELAIAALVLRKEAAIAPLEAALDKQPPQGAAVILDDVLPILDPLYMDLRNLRERPLAARRQAAIRFSTRAKGRTLPKAAWARVRAALTNETDGMVRRLLVERLFDAEDPGVTVVLIEGLTQDDPRTRQSSALQLGKLKSRLALPHLVKALQDERSTVQQAAAWALGEIGDPSAVEPLEKALVAHDVSSRLAFGAALARLGARSGRDELVRLMFDTATAVQVEAAEAMTAAPHECYIPTLIERLDERNPRLTAAATEALRKITGKDFGYRPNAGKEVRDQAVAQWKTWFKTTQRIRTPGEP